MGYSSSTYQTSIARFARYAGILGLVFIASLLESPNAEAQTTRFGARAGSRFVNPGSTTQRRPLRRRSTSVAQVYSEPASDFNYQLDADPTDESALLALLASEEDADLVPVGYCDNSSDCACDDCYCGDSIEADCGCNSCCDDCCEPSCGMAGGGFGGGAGYPAWFAGAEFTFVKPRFSENVAFTTLDDDGAGTRTFTDTEFDYDLEMSPRVWLGAAFTDAWSWRCTYWQFDQSPATETTSPPANGNGSISHPNFSVENPQFADVDLTTNVPTDIYTTSSDLNAYTIDIEAVKNSQLNRWLLGVAGGVRYASTEQSYSATLNDGTANTDQLDYTQELEGIGPTISLSGMRPFYERIHLVCAARGSLLFGDGVSRFDAVEDLTGAPETTIRVTNREDLLPIGEARIGFEWMSRRTAGGTRWLVSTAMEGQIWGNAGNASNANGDLGFYGFSLGAGFLR